MGEAAGQSFAAGQQVAGYRILGKVGAGGMGVVYRAEDTKLGRQVALKFLGASPEATEQARSRLLREARAASNLDHVNISTIHSIEETPDGQLFIVMAYYDGETLAAHIGRGARPVPEALDLAIQIARGLAAAHSKGVVHRDIKPSNIIITPDGVVKILDFGLAKLADSRQLTQTGSTVGTAAYMSPEQARGEPADHRSDMWSLGVVLYQILTARLPFGGDSTPSVLYAVVHERPPAMEGIHTGLERIVMRCLRKLPSERYQSAESLIADLRAVAGGSLDEIETEVMDSLGNPEPPALPAIGAGRRSSTTAGSVATRAGSSRRKLWIAAGALMVVASGLLLVFQLGGLPFKRGDAAKRKVAVLPFTNIGNVAANQLLSDGLMEVITSELSSLESAGESLWVVPASEVRRLKLTGPDEARQALGAHLVVTGSVQKQGSSVRLTVNLVDAETLRQIDSAGVNDPLGDFSTLQDDVVAGLAKMLRLEAKATPPSGRRSSAPDNYEAYLRAVGYLQRFDKADSVDEAVKLLEQTIERDPAFSLALAKLGEAYWLRFRLNQDQRWRDKAEQYSRKAAQTDPSLAAAHVTLGRIASNKGEHDLALEAFRRALQSDARNSDALTGTALAYEGLGRIAEAEEILKSATAQRPDFWGGHLSLGNFHQRQKRYAEAETQYRQALVVTPDNGVVYSNLGVLLNRMGRGDEAQAMHEKAIQLNPTFSGYSNLGSLYFERKRYADAANTFEQALKLNDTSHRLWGNLGAAYSYLPGMKDKARMAYMRAAEIGEEAVKQEPDNATLQAAVGSYYANINQPDKAARRLEAAAALAPKDQNVMIEVADAYESLDMHAQARKFLARALDLGYSKERLSPGSGLRVLADQMSSGAAGAAPKQATPRAPEKK